MSRAINQIAFMTPWTKPADDWSRAKAAEMDGAGYAAGTIIRHLEACMALVYLPHRRLFAIFKTEAHHEPGRFSPTFHISRAISCALLFS